LHESSKSNPFFYFSSPSPISSLLRYVRCLYGILIRAMRDARVPSYARRRSRACIIYELGDVKGQDGRTLRTRPDPSMAVVR
jgi:hypothetical protein